MVDVALKETLSFTVKVDSAHRLDSAHRRLAARKQPCYSQKAMLTTKKKILKRLKNSAPATLMSSTQKRPALPMPRISHALFSAVGKNVVCTVVAKPMV